MRFTMIAAALLATAAPATAQAQPTPAAPDYAKAADWLCLPGRADSCSTPLATTALSPNGYGSNGRSAVAKDPPIDCFYVYPTVSDQKTGNANLNVDPEERSIALYQAARYSQY